MTEIEAGLALAGFDKDRPMKVGAIWAPPVARVEGEFLIYRLGDRAKRNASQGLLRGLLDAKSSPEAIIRFCKRWGVLGLCEHGIPASHGSCVSRRAFHTEMVSGVSGIKASYGRESIASVRRFAGALESLLRIGAEMSQGRRGAASEWANAEETICGPDFPMWDPSPSTVNDLDISRNFLQMLVRRLIEICRIVPRFFWNRDTKSWQIDLDSQGSGNNLPALLTIELIVTIADKDGFAICSSCHRAYIPARRPDPTRRNYCPQCGLAAAQRDAAREYRRRLRETDKHVLHTSKRKKAS
jgi:hypothetical protein